MARNVSLLSFVSTGRAGLNVPNDVHEVDAKERKKRKGILEKKSESKRASRNQDTRPHVVTSFPGGEGDGRIEVKRGDVR